MAAESGQTRWVAAGLAVWLAAAVLVGASGALRSVRPPAPQVLIVALTAGLLAAGALVPWLRRWAEEVDLRVVVALHLTRFVGAYFLVLHRRGELPYAFAVPGGWGDIAVASLALVLLVAVRPSGAWGRWLYLGWDVLGLIDILGVVATAASQGMAEPGSMRALLRLPLSLLPTFLVPLIIASHVLIFVRLLRGRRSDRPPDAEPGASKDPAGMQAFPGS
jgi:hypothetical protein